MKSWWYKFVNCLTSYMPSGKISMFIVSALGVWLFLLNCCGLLVGCWLCIFCNPITPWVFLFSLLHNPLLHSAIATLIGFSSQLIQTLVFWESCLYLQYVKHSFFRSETQNDNSDNTEKLLLLKVEVSMGRSRQSGYELTNLAR